MGLGAADQPLVATRTGLSPVGDLAELGRQLLLGSSGTAADDETAALGFEVLVSAARQHLMSAAPDHLSVGQVLLLAADYAGLAAYGLERQLLTRCAVSFGGREAR